MRVSDSLRYTALQRSITKIGQQLNDVEIKLSTQKNINAPSDDPIKFATNVQLDAERTIGSQFTSNLQRLNILVSMYGTSFSSIGDQLTTLSQLAVNFGTADASIRQSSLAEIEGIIEQLVTVGNTKLGEAYIFGGGQSNVAPLQLNNDYSVTFNTAQIAEDASRIYMDKSEEGQYGISGRASFYGSSKIAYGSVGNEFAGDIYSNTGSFAYVVGTGNDEILLGGSSPLTLTLTDGTYTGTALAQEMQHQLGSSFVVNGTNNTIYVGDNAVTLASGTYTGGGVTGLATEIQNKLNLVQAGHTVTYDDLTRKFTIANSGAAETFKWSDPRATAGNLLGYDSIDSLVSNTTPDASDRAAAIQFSVGFDTTTRKFLITNNAGGDVTFNWSTSNAGSLLGFNNADTVVVAGATEKSDLDTGRKSFLIKIISSGPTTGAAGRATYRYSIDGGSTWVGDIMGNPITVSTGGADTTAGDITIGATNNTLYRNGLAVIPPITNGTYTGAALATEIQTRLNAVQVGHSVTYDASTRKFTIINNTGATETYNWSNAGANAAGVLGFDTVDSVVSSGTSDVGDYDAGMFIDGSGVANTTNNRIKFAFSTGLTDDISIDATNNTLYLSNALLGSTAVNLNSGTYTGSALATEIQTRLNAIQAGHSVTYDALTRRFTITNNTAPAETYNWSNTGATAAGVLGFNTVDSPTLNPGGSDISDYNTGSTDLLTTADTFQVKDLSIFELLKNFRDAIVADDRTWVSKNTQYFNRARELTTKNAAVVAFQGTQATTLINNYKTKDANIEKMQSDLVGADASELAMELNVLMNTYQALLASMSKVLSISILNYLK